jgi:hypothetical protein
MCGAESALAIGVTPYGNYITPNGGFAKGNNARCSMAKNTGMNYRVGSVTGRSQFQHENGDWQKRDDHSGQFMHRKSSEGPFKGVAREPDGRRSR